MIFVAFKHYFIIFSKITPMQKNIIDIIKKNDVCIRNTNERHTKRLWIRILQPSHKKFYIKII